MFFLVFVLFLDCFFNMHLCAKLQPYSSKYCLQNMDFAFALLIYTLSHSLSRSA